MKHSYTYNKASTGGDRANYITFTVGRIEGFDKPVKWLWCLLHAGVISRKIEIPSANEKHVTEDVHFDGIVDKEFNARIWVNDYDPEFAKEMGSKIQEYLDKKSMEVIAFSRMQDAIEAYKKKRKEDDNV